MSAGEVMIREMIAQDIDQVLLIEESSFATPWSRDAFKSELNENPYATYFVIEIEEGVVGYCGLWMVIDEAHITNIAILPEYRGNGLGELLFNYVLNRAKQRRVVSLSLEVRVSNIIAQKMYRKYGLVPGGIRKNYYTDNQEDALVMWVKL